MNAFKAVETIKQPRDGRGSIGKAHSCTLAAPLGPLMKSLLISYYNYCVFLSPKNTKMED
jgi:hypothetical protein